MSLVTAGFILYYHSAWKFLTQMQKYGVSYRCVTHAVVSRIGSWVGVLTTLFTFAWVSNSDPGEVNDETIEVYGTDMWRER